MMRIAAILGVALLSGCASFGNPEYGCTGLPEGVRCTATRDLYDATNRGEVPRSQAPDVETKNERDPDSKSKPKNEKAEAVEVRPVTDPVVDTFVTPNLPDRPVPIRTPAQVMRIWVASWEDTETGALITPGYIYTEIEPRRWVIGKPESAAAQQGQLFKPLEQSSPTSSSKKKGKE
ncbi:MAG: type IV conjugative transfer system lipoprotein TraV [Candidatus Thiodiazotropha endolucinida]|nr:type IV conjugative transfer system lipoprotein TraV [Candidatus Thiodiazotropha taylori]MCW4297448.1 type IV conjugative transfer system lipoprotein TraV [Candidatus Thiodiazotropha endolucinida]